MGFGRREAGNIDYLGGGVESILNNANIKKENLRGNHRRDSSTGIALPQ